MIHPADAAFDKKVLGGVWIIDIEMQEVRMRCSFEYVKQFLDRDLRITIPLEEQTQSYAAFGDFAKVVKEKVDEFYKTHKP